MLRLRSDPAMKERDADHGHQRADGETKTACPGLDLDRQHLLGGRRPVVLRAPHVLWFYALPSGSTYLVVLDALLLVVSAVTVWALVSNRPRLAPTLLGATVLLALPAVAIWVAVLAFIALAILVRSARARRSGERFQPTAGWR
jgi:hypothetical protein